MRVDGDPRLAKSVAKDHVGGFPADPGEPKEHLLMAGTVMMVLPCVAIFFLAQRYFVQGIVMSGIKG